MTSHIATDPGLAIEDITDTLPAIVAQAQAKGRDDRVFSVAGTFVKVRIARRAAPAGVGDYGAAFLEISGAECGPDGLALPYGSGHRIAPASVYSLQPDLGVSVDLAADLAAQRLIAVRAALHASAVASAVDAFLPCVTPPPLSGATAT